MRKDEQTLQTMMSLSIVQGGHG